MLRALLAFLIGQPVPNIDAERRRIGVFAGIPAMGLDLLASVSYGPEAALAVLAAVGPARLLLLPSITWAIVGLLIVLCCSYWQTIGAYPNNGGSYIVAHQNLGANAGVMAAAALMVDYVLTVAVGITAGVGALGSALPQLYPYRLWLCIEILVVITLSNLRGTRQTALVWAIPAYLFIASLGGTLLWGIGKTALANGHPIPLEMMPQSPPLTEPVTAGLVLRAFATGCTAMTGVEAVANSVSAFREPRTLHARSTLTIIVVVLSAFLLAVAYLSKSYATVAMDQGQPGYQSLLSELVAAICGRGWFYYLTLACILAVLCLSANTSFVAFPRMCNLLARDGYLPSGFATPDRRLVYSAGILFLATAAGFLILVFQGITDQLIPLYAVGAFLAFTLSQSGMAARWWKRLDGSDSTVEATGPSYATSTSSTLIKLAVNAIGATASGVSLVIILCSKLGGGAWITLVIIGSIVTLLKRVHAYYDDIARRTETHRPISVRRTGSPIVLLPIQGWDLVSRKAIEVALTLSDDVTALHVTTLTGQRALDDEADLRRAWRQFVEQPTQEAGLPAPPLRMVQSQYRSLLGPVLRAIGDANRRAAGRPVLVVLPEIVESHSWDRLLHRHRERRLRVDLERFGGPNIAVLAVPWHVAPPGRKQALAIEEPPQASVAQHT